MKIFILPMKKVFLSIVFFVMCFVSFGQDTPKSIQEALEYFDKTWTEEIKTEFKSKAPLYYHLTLGMGIRNDWLRHGSGNESLKDELYVLGATDLDDMSHIILTLLNKKLKNETFNLEEEINQLKNEWKEKHNVNDKVFEVYKKHKKGDSISFYILKKNNKRNNGIFYYFNENEEIDRDKFYKISGIVTTKIRDYMCVELTYLESDKIYLYKKHKLKIEEQCFDIFKNLKIN